MAMVLVLIVTIAHLVHNIIIARSEALALLGTIFCACNGEEYVLELYMGRIKYGVIM
ncbi:MAG: hypothetical protein J6Y29_00365 [Clostridiales bacterium]|nr:hypothetical protein [Clostridiales bacterium]